MMEGGAWSPQGIQVEREAKGKERGAELSAGHCTGDPTLAQSPPSNFRKSHNKEEKHLKTLISCEKCSEEAEICVRVNAHTGPEVGELRVF